MTTATAVRERPILFSGEMVHAILDGRKSQTRRVMKLQPTIDPSVLVNDGVTFAMWPGESEFDACECHCPYGSVGERLWVRETFVLEANEDDPDNPIPHYRATEPEPYLVTEEQDDLDDRTRWKPAIHMPRWASRIMLEITGVRVERLQDISASDIWQEGVRPEGVAETAGDGEGDRVDPTPLLYAEFERLWNSLNGKRPGCDLASNPWVWKISFKRVGGNT